MIGGCCIGQCCDEEWMRQERTHIGCSLTRTPHRLFTGCQTHRYYAVTPETKKDTSDFPAGYPIDFEKIDG